MNINIKNLHIHICPMMVNKELNRVNESHLNATGSTPEESRYCRFTEAPDGIYIATKSGNCWKEEYFSECKEEAVGIAIVKGSHRIIVNKNGSDKELPLLDSDKVSGLKIHSTYRECVKDFNGYDNTEALLALGSPAAEFCKKLGKQWYIPSGGEMDMMDEYCDDLDRMLPMIGGTPLSKGWHWSSTRYSNKSYFVLNWGDGIRCNLDQYCIDWVRAVSASL